MQGVFIFAQIGLFIWLRKTMKASLNGYYTQNSKNLKILAAINTIYFSLIVGKKLFMWISDIDESILSDADNSTYSNTHKLIYVIYTALMFTPFYLYVYWNINNIYFKIYLFTLLTGCRVEHMYDSSSIFVRKS